MSVFAGLIDWLVCAFSLGEYRKCGYLHIDLSVAGVGLTLTVVAMYTWRQWWKERAAQQAQATPPKNLKKPPPPPAPPENTPESA